MNKLPAPPHLLAFTFKLKPKADIEITPEIQSWLSLCEERIVEALQNLPFDPVLHCEVRTLRE